MGSTSKGWRPSSRFFGFLVTRGRLGRFGRGALSRFLAFVGGRPGTLPLRGGAALRSLGSGFGLPRGGTAGAPVGLGSRADRAPRRGSVPDRLRRVSGPLGALRRSAGGRMGRTGLRTTTRRGAVAACGRLGRRHGGVGLPGGGGGAGRRIAGARFGRVALRGRGGDGSGGVRAGGGGRWPPWRVASLARGAVGISRGARIRDGSCAARSSFHSRSGA